MSTARERAAMLGIRIADSDYHEVQSSKENPSEERRRRSLIMSSIEATALGASLTIAITVAMSVPKEEIGIVTNLSAILISSVSILYVVGKSRLARMLDF